MAQVTRLLNKTINLLPTDLAPNAAIVRFAVTCRYLALFGTVAFLVTVVAMVGIFTVNAGLLKASNTRQERYKTSIRSMETTEQQLVLSTDRASRAKLIFDTIDAFKQVNIFKEIRDSMPEDVRFGKVDISVNKTEMGLKVPSYSSLAQTLGTITNIEDYKSIHMTSFSYSPTTGYTFELEMSN